MSELAHSFLIQVKDKAGDSVKGVLVAIEWSDVPFPEIALITDKNGTVSLFLPAGRFRIIANAPNGQSGVVNVISNQESSNEQILITLH